MGSIKTWYLDTKQPEIIALTRADPKLGQLISLVGNVEFTLRPNRFQSLVRSITGQLISVAAADTIFSRVLQLTNGTLTPEQVAQIDDEAILKCGFSKRKLNYLRDLQHGVQTDKLDLNLLDQKDDQTVIKELTNIKGIGIWTAQMFLIFSLQRQNVLAVDDIGLQRSARWLYQVDQSQRRGCLDQKQAIWSPFATIASIYLWEAVQMDWVRQYASLEDVNPLELR